MNLQDILNSGNIAEELTEQQLAEIAERVKTDYDTDCYSRKAWEKAYENWIGMTNQAIEYKTKPWQGAANIKYPLMTQAALNFNARMMPAMMPNNEPVGTEVFGADPTGERNKISRGVSKHMNYQLVTEMDEWEEEMDATFMALSISGQEYKKTYFDPLLGRNVSRHITPLNLVINYYADKMENSRKTERHRWTKNYILEKINAGFFRDIDWEEHPDPTPSVVDPVEANNAENLGHEEPSTVDSATPFLALEQHAWLDLDEDGYEEPYIITMMADSLEILQITPRFDDETIIMDAEGAVIKIEAYESYTKYGFIPNPDGSFYDIGFGQLLYPINAVVNTSINMMLDAGASSIMNSGFIGRGVKMRGGMFQMKPNTWFQVNAAGDDIRKNFVPMPATGPDQVLLNLMMYMVEAGQKLSSTTDIFSGEMPGQNTKTGVTQAVRDEGQKIFTGIYKRIRRAFKRELDKLYELNGIVLAAEGGQATKIAKSAQVFEVQPEFYNREMVNIQPSADPNVAIKEQKVQKAMANRQMIMETGIGDLVAAQRAAFIAMETENIEQLLPEDFQQQPDPAAQAEAMKAQMEASQADFEAQMREKEFELEVAKAQFNAMLEKTKLELQAAQQGQAAKMQDVQFRFEVDRTAEEMNERRQAASAEQRPTGEAV